MEEICKNKLWHEQQRPNIALDAKESVELKLKETYEAILKIRPSQEYNDVLCPICGMHTSYAFAFSENSQLKIERDIEHYRACIVNDAERYLKNCN